METAFYDLVSILCVLWCFVLLTFSKKLPSLIMEINERRIEIHSLLYQIIQYARYQCQYVVLKCYGNIVTK